MAFRILLAVFLSALTSFADESAPTDGEVWNAGVEAYRAGDVTNALRILRPLMLTKTHGARAAEVVAKLEHERGNRDEAASAAQIALRANPTDAKANRNFTRATDGLLAEREEKRLAEILKAAEGKDPGAMLLGATKEARKLLAEAGGFRTNAPARAVALADRLERRATALADVWPPVRQVVSQSVTNEEQAATIIDQLDQATAKTKKAAKAFGDLDADAYAAMSDVEHDFTRFLKLTVLPPGAIGEGLAAQSNAWLDVEGLNGRSWQGDALDFTRAFRAKFPAWAQAYEQAAQSDTNKPPFTKEAQAKVSALATEVEKLQIECTKKALPPSQKKAIMLLQEIQELLPKDKGGSGQQGQPQQNQQQQDQQKQDQQQQQDQQNQQESDQQQDQDPDNPDENPSEEPQADPGEQPDEQPEDKELEATLKKAQERNDEHEAEKKARMRKAPLPPNERDW